MPALLAVPALCVASASAFAVADALAQHLELRYCTAVPRAPAPPAVRYSQNSEGYAIFTDTNTSSNGGPQLRSSPAYQGFIHIPRIALFGSVGAASGLIAIPIVELVSALIPSEQLTAILAKIVLIEALYAPAVCAIILCAGAYYRSQSPEDVQEKPWEKARKEFWSTLWPQTLLTPSWSLLFGTSVPIPGFQFGLPPGAFILACHVPYLVFATHKAARPHYATPPEGTQRGILPFCWSDFFSKSTAQVLGLYCTVAYLDCAAQVVCDWVGRDGVLWDPLFVILPHIKAVWLCDMFTTFSLLLMIGHQMLNEEPCFPVLFRLTIMVFTSSLFFRALLLVPGAVALPNPDLACVPTHSGALPIAALQVLFGAGHTCRDLMFSGHAGMMIVSALYIHEYSESAALKCCSWTLAGVGMTTVVATHLHYTLDVLVAAAIDIALWHVCGSVFHVLTGFRPSLKKMDSFAGKAADAATVGLYGEKGKPTENQYDAYLIEETEPPRKDTKT